MKKHSIELLTSYLNNHISKDELIQLFDWINSQDGQVEYDQYLLSQLDALKEYNNISLKYQINGKEVIIEYINKNKCKKTRKWLIRKKYRNPIITRKQSGSNEPNKYLLLI